MLKNFKKWLAKEAFYKVKCEKGLQELGEILKNIEHNQAETEQLKKQSEVSLTRLKLAMSKFEN